MQEDPESPVAAPTGEGSLTRIDGLAILRRMTGASVLLWIAGVPLGLFLANLSEWLVHRHVLHGLGRRRSSFWSFHWHEHHRAARRNAMFDPDYERFPIGWHAQGKEILGLSLGAIPALAVAPWMPTLGLTLVGCGVEYWYKHRRAHLDPAWARAHLPWHVDHHLGRDQDANWCVTRPWCDRLFGTRKPWLGTAEERGARPAAADAA